MRRAVEVGGLVLDFGIILERDRGIAWHDPVLMITWPVTVETLIVSDRDRALPRLAGQSELFEYTRQCGILEGDSKVRA